MRIFWRLHPQKYCPRPRLSPRLSNDRRPRTSTDSQYPVLPAAVSAMYSVTKNFSAKGMSDVTSYMD